MKVLLLALFGLLAQGCTPVDELPQSASYVDFSGEGGKIGWSKYKQVKTFNGWNSDQVYAAAKVSLGDTGFSLVRSSSADGYVVGDHGKVLRDWNVIAAVYFMEYKEGTKVVVLAEGSNDIGFSGETSVGVWPDKVLNRMQKYLDDLYSSAPKVVLKE